MADDSLSLEVVIDYISRNQPKSLAEILQMQEGLADLNRKGLIPLEGSFKNHSRDLLRMEKQWKDGKYAISQYSEEFKKLLERLQEADAAFKKTAQDAASGGSLKPTKDAAAGIGLQEARELVAIEDARKASVVSASREIVAAREREIQAANRLKQSIKDNQSAVQSAQTSRAYEKELAALTPLEAATRRVADARRELYNANRQVSRAQDAGNLDRQNQALVRQEKAVRGAAAAEAALRREQQNAAKNVDDLAGRLPRLRYALYDVSSAFTIAGAAILAVSVGTAGLAISMERDFADVRRTTGAAGVAARDLRSDFNDLFTSLPIKWDALTQIGTLAGQLNIASTDVSRFTELVAKFSATTDVSVQDSATAFGRLSQLLGVSAADYDRLGSSILKVGVNSVATESQIIAISTQIAGVARQANFSADQVFGLSAAMASLGIQPELSRGTITRLFTLIEVATANGGESLERFAKISGRSSVEFRQAWGTDSAGVVLDLLRGLDQINERGGSATAALRELGITSVRDVPALLRMAQSSEMVAEALQLSADGWAENTELNKQFGVVADTVAAKLETIVNKGQALVATLGSGAAGAQIVVGALGMLLDVLNNIAKNPFVSSLAGIGLVFGIITGGVSLLVGGLIRSLATMAAFRTAQRELTSGTGQWSAAIASATAILHGNTAAITTNAAATRELSVAQKQAGASGEVAAAGGSKFTKALGRGGLIGSILLAIPLIYELADATQSWISDGIRNLFGLNKSISEYQAHLEAISKEQVGDPGIANAIQKNLQAVAALGGSEFGLDDFFLKGPLGGAALQQTQDQIKSIDTALASMAQNGQAAFATTQVNSYVQSLIAAGLSADEAKGFFQQTFDALGGGELVLDQLGSALDDYVEGQKAALDSILEPIGAANKLESALEDLGGVYRSAGADAAQSSDEMAAAIQQVFDMDPSNAANNLQLLFNTIVNGGYASAQQLLILQQAIAALGGATGAASIRGADIMSALAAGATTAGQKISKSAGGAARSVRTLLDYSSDLAKVWNRAFDIRFGAQSAMDDVIGSWQDLNDEIADYQQKVLELTADKNIKEYFLSVAEAYGDTLRAGQLRADLADIDSQLADATAGASKTLTGNSKAAITNRKRILGLIKGYQDYIESLAASGASQSELNAAVAQSKADFIAQATALGYATNELAPYIKGFDDMTVAIAKVPRNVTVTANTNPAMQALNEFLAAAKKATGGGITIPVHVSDPTPLANGFVNKFRQVMTTKLGGVFQILVNGKPIPGGGSTTLKFFDQGGFTGTGAKMTPAGIVHRGEYVIPKKDVNQRTGLPYADALGRLQAGTIARNSYAGGGYVRGAGAVNLSIPSPMEVQLTATDRRLLQSLGGSGQLVADGRIIAEVVNNNNAASSRRGQ